MRAAVNEKSLGTHFTEFRTMVVGYVKQEITEPLRGAARYLKLGLIGGLIGIVAGVMLSVGILRLVQTTTVLGLDHGAWSWLAYVVAGLVCVGIGVLFVVLGLRSDRRKNP